MKNKIYTLGIIAFSVFFFESCASQRLASPPPPPPPPIEAMQAMRQPASISQAKQEFRNFRQAMGYLDANGKAVDNKSGYFDLSAQTLKALYDEAVNNGWSNVRIYNGIDNAGNRTLLMNGLVENSGKFGESSKTDSDFVARIENPSVAGGSDCPRWCDVTGTAVGK